MKKEKVGLFYLYIYSKMYDHFAIDLNSPRVQKKEVSLFLRNWRIPKIIRPIFLKELENAGLLLLRNGAMGTATLKPIKLKPINDYYKELNFYH